MQMTTRRITVGDLAILSRQCSAQRAVKLAPQEPVPLRTLGVACYRAGNFQEAEAALATVDGLGEMDGKSLLVLASEAQAATRGSSQPCSLAGGIRGRTRISRRSPSPAIAGRGPRGTSAGIG